MDAELLISDLDVDFLKLPNAAIPGLSAASQEAVRLGSLRAAESVAKALKEARFACGYCPLTFSSQRSLNLHGEVHDWKRHRCPVCNKCFERRATLHNHKRTHSKAKPFACDVCSKPFRWKNSLKYHLKRHSRPSSQEPVDEVKTFFARCVEKQQQNREKEVQAIVEIIKRTADTSAANPAAPAFSGASKSAIDKHSVESAAQDGQISSGNLTGNVHPQKSAQAKTIPEKPRVKPQPNQKLKFRQYSFYMKQYVCKLCNEAFERRSALYYHLKKHSDATPYVCETCGRGFKWPNSLKTHRNAHIRETANDRNKDLRSRVIPPPKPTGQFAKVTSLQIGEFPDLGQDPASVSSQVSEALVITNSEVSADVRIDLSAARNVLLEKSTATARSQLPGAYKSAIERSAGQAKDSFMKITVSYRPVTPECLREELADPLNPPRAEFACDKCPLSFRFAATLKYHQELGHEMQYACTQCNALFLDEATLYAHVRKHAEDKPYACERCGLAFAWKSALKRHRSTHKQLPAINSVADEDHEVLVLVKEEPIADDNPDREDMQEDCLRNGSPVSSQSSISMSETSLRNDESASSSNYSTDRLTTAPDNEASFENASNNPQNAPKSAPPRGRFACGECPMTFCTEAMLKHHQEYRHEKQHVCPLCYEVFQQRWYLNYHVMRKHANERPYVCEACGSGFKCASSLKSHMSSHKREPCKDSATESSADGYLDNLEPTHEDISSVPLSTVVKFESAFDDLMQSLSGASSSSNNFKLHADDSKSDIFATVVGVPNSSTSQAEPGLLKQSDLLSPPLLNGHHQRDGLSLSNATPDILKLAKLQSWQEQNKGHTLAKLVPDHPTTSAEGHEPAAQRPRVGVRGTQFQKRVERSLKQLDPVLKLVERIKQETAAKSRQTGSQLDQILWI